MFLLLYMVIFMPTKHALLAEDFTYVNPLLYGAAFTNVTLQATITAIGTSRATIALPTGTWVISSNLTIPANIDLIVPAGALLTRNPGVSLVLNGGLIAPQVQIFSGTGTTVFGQKVGTVYPQWWGATFDGATDDLAALQAAVSTGREVLCPPGTAILSAPLSVPSNTTLRGTSGATILKCAANFGNNPLLVTSVLASTLGARNSNIRLRDLTLDGNRANNGTGGGLSSTLIIRSSVDVWVENVTSINAFAYGIYIDYGSTSAIYCERIHIRSCYVFNCGQACIHATSGDGILIEGNTVEGTNTNGIAVILTASGSLLRDVRICQNRVANGVGVGQVYGIAASAATGLTATDILIVDNTVLAWPGTGAAIAYNNIIGCTIRHNQSRSQAQGIADLGGPSTTELTIQGNRIRDCAARGILYVGTAPASISGNLVRVAVTAGIDVQNMTAGVVSQNAIQSVNGSGILLTTVGRSSICGNTCYTNNANGINLLACLDNAVQGNACEQNQGTGIQETTGSDYTAIVGNICRANSTAQITTVGVHTVLSANLAS